MRQVDRRGNSAALVGFWWWDMPKLASRLLDECAAEVNKEAVTLLMAAVERGSFDQVRYLIDRKGADVTAVDAHGRGVLFRVSVYQQDAMVKARLLLDRGAEVNRADRAGVTPLMGAVSAGHTDFVRLLLRYGAELAPRDNEGRTARGRAVRYGKAETANLLLLSERNPQARSNL